MGLWETVQAIYIGLFASDVLPLRPGEIIRGYLLAIWGEIPFSLTLTSMVIERVLDGIWLVAAFWIAASLMSMPPALVDFAQVLAFGVVAAGGAVPVYPVSANSTRTRFCRAGDGAGSFFTFSIRSINWATGARWRPHSASRVSTGSCRFSRCGRCSAATTWIFRSGRPSVVLVIKSIGTVIPSAPGNLGVLQSVVKMALTLFVWSSM